MRAALAVALALPIAATSPVEQRIGAIARENGGTVGVAAVLVETGERVSLNGDEPIPMQSVFKLPVALRALQLVDEGRLRLDEQVTLTATDLRRGHSPIRDRWPHGVTLTIEELFRFLLVESDNTAADVLMTRGGGPAGVTARLRELGVTAVRVDRGEDELARDLLDGGPGALQRYLADPRDTATANAAADLLVLVARGGGLKPDTHARLERWLVETTTGRKRIRALLPAGVVVGDRTGTGPDIGGVNACTNDIGLITLPDGRHVALAVLTKGSRRPADERERTIARIALAVYRHWTAKR